jgi:hypothetical protein
LRRDLTRFELFRPSEDIGADGDVKTAFNPKPDFVFSGHIQPFSQNENPAEYGLDPRYAYVIYAESSDFRELDRIVGNDRIFEIRLIQRQKTYLRLIAKDVTDNG